jgi:hypothetical protein
VFRRFLGGAGLGLAIVRENARILGAELTVHSIVGVGTRFTVRLPAVDEELEIAQSAAPRVRGFRLAPSRVRCSTGRCRHGR